MTSDSTQGGAEMVENMTVEEQGQLADVVQHSESEKQATDLDVPDAAGDTIVGAGGGAAEYDPLAVIVPIGEDGEGAEEAEEEEEDQPHEQPAEADMPPANPAPVALPAKKPKAVGGFIDSDSEDESGPAANDGDGDEYDPAQLTADNYNPPLLMNNGDGHPQQPPAANAPRPPPPGPRPDHISVLEARIADDPRGAVDSWLELISDHRQNNRFDEARSVFTRFLDVFPEAAEVWVDYIEMELELENFAAAESLFAKSLTKVVNVPLWVVYLDYVRRRNNLNDAGSEARTVVSRAYEFVLDHVGMDKDSGRIWQDYVQFIRSAPGTIGGSSWQDQQKMDQLRKAFRRATSVPISNVNQLWKEYDQFEMGLNKITGRKFLAERSPAYMSAKSANTALENTTRGLVRTTIPRLPPMIGFEGHQEYMAQVRLWHAWIDWEKTDPLDLQVDEPEVLKARILYCYKQALMPLRFWPELWVEAAEWCFENDIKEKNNPKSEQGLAFLVEGIEANPESILVALKHADRIESTFPIEDGDAAKIARGQAVREPYDHMIKTLRDLHKSLQDREKAEVARIEETLAAAAQAAGKGDNHYGDRRQDDDDDDDVRDASNGVKKSAAAELDPRITLIKQGFAAQMDLVSKCLTHVWIALARAMRRIQGKGSPQGPLGGMRQVFAEARKGGRLKSDIYVAVAKMEWKCYNDKAGGKIFERGAKLFPEDPYFMIEYIEYLTAHGDNTNSRVVFETCVNKLAQKPETVHKAKPLLTYMHKREAEYGDLARVAELEKRMAELFPTDPRLVQFAKRFATEKFDPVAARIIISPAAQLRPRLVLPSVEKPGQGLASLRNSPMPLGRANSPRIGLLPASVGSPKRPYAADDFGDEGGIHGNNGNAPPRKMLRSADHREFQRGESPLKGAAGRRLDQQRRAGGAAVGGAYGGGLAVTGGGQVAPPPPLPTMVSFLLGQLPPAAQYNGARFSSPGLVHMLREIEIDPNAAYEVGRQRSGGGAGGGRYGRGQHGRQASSEYHHRASPGPGAGGRGNSPYTGGGGGSRVPSGGYHGQSSLRPDAPNAYEPPPFEWSGGGAPPPPQGYGAAPPGYQPPGQYGGYRY